MAHKNDDGVEVTEENFGDLLIQGLREARAVVRGDAEPARRTRRTMTVREADVRPPRSYTGVRIRKIREDLGISQNLFARVLNASPDTVKAWEQDRRHPDGMALTLLDVAERHPEALLDRVHAKAGKPMRERTRR